MSDSPYDAVLRAAAGLARAETALTAELVGTALLGSVYAVAERARVGAVRDFVSGYLAHIEADQTPAAGLSRVVFASLVPDATGAAQARPAPSAPAWVAQLGRVRVVDGWAYGDVYGDQTSFLATFAYDDPESGGGEHAVVALVDHNIGIVKDMFVGEPADRLLAEVRRAVESDELVWLRRVEPAELRAQVAPYLAVTDELSMLPEGGSLATDRILAGARLASLPGVAELGVAAAPGAPVGLGGGPGAATDPADPTTLVESFLASPPAQALDRAGEAGESLRYILRLILDFAEDAPDRDPLRWSPAVVGLFLLDWLHRRAVLDRPDVSVLPEVLRAWVAWAGQRRGLPAAARTATEEAVAVMTPEFSQLYASGERRGPAVAVVAQLLADGVDPDDEPAVRDWLAAHPELAGAEATVGDATGGDPGGAEAGDGDRRVPHPR